ncbi:hypothetical protein F3087_34200 [Nocardia colli]|uniref:Phthiocerol/phthiodiolone dimycocerosyl transferase n=1 Tax=Nocardia colli TaxID=2545717 RepID=A0A5N0E4B7_9NOCA|nr:hypothetical protein [Nocardia colli]KAA8884278.1 hypothetical protein F3087_34200 [Nocardia colli]
MQYRLGKMDEGFVPKQFTVCYVTVCEGEIDSALLQLAFELTARRYPMLTGTIALADGECLLRIPDDDAGTVVTETVHGSLSDWLRNGAIPLDPARELAKLEIVQTGQTAAVCLRVCHAINDAHMGFALLADFWRTAAALSTGAALLDPTPIYPRSLEYLLADRGVTLPDPALPDPGRVYSFADSETLDGPGRRLAPGERITLSENETGRLVQHARALGTTVHALLSAAIVRAERATIAETPDTAVETELPMLIGHAVDLRPHLQPPARPADATNALGFAPTVTACTTNSDLHILGKEIKAQIVHGIESGTALAAMHAAAYVMQSDTREIAVNTITNWGVVPTLASPEGMRINDFRGFATSAPVPELSYFVYTFHGRLNIEFAYSERHHRPERVAHLRNVVAANLQQVVPEPA